MEKKVILFGSVPLATKALKLLLKHPKVDLVGVICQEESRNFNYSFFREERSVFDYVTEITDIPILKLEDIEKTFKKHELYLGVSVRFNRIFSKSLIEFFEKAIVNFHGGPLPQYRGVDSANYAILHKNKKFSGTLHYITEGIDEGPIINRKWFEIEPNDTVFTVFQEVEKSLSSLFEENLDNIIENKDKPIPQEEFIKKGEKTAYYSREDLHKYKKINLEDDIEQIFRIVRAFDFPNKEPAYIERNGKRIYLRTNYKYNC